MSRTRVVPTHVGMVRGVQEQEGRSLRCPHARGDGPHITLAFGTQSGLSPRTWGWSGRFAPRWPPESVVPTHVGMVRELARRQRDGRGCPHARGDGPSYDKALREVNPLSPRTWGWSARFYSISHVLHVVPTHVGMVRCRSYSRYPKLRCPHARGDGPEYPCEYCGWCALSPRTWGWSENRPGLSVWWYVVPTHVGMVRAGRRVRL